MPLITARPAGIISYISGGLAVLVQGSGDVRSVLADDSDATDDYYVNVGNAFPVTPVMNFTDLSAVPANSRYEWARLRSRLALVGAYNQRVGVWVATDRSEWSEEMIVVRDGAIREWDGSQKGVRPSTGKEWTTDDLSSITAYAQFYDLDNLASGDVYLYELYLDAQYRRPGSVDSVTIDSAAKLQPVVSWTCSAIDSPAQPQGWYWIRVFDQATYTSPHWTFPTDPAQVPIWDSGQINAAVPRSATIGKRLRNGTTYRAYVQVAQPWPHGQFWAPTSGIVEFTVAIAPLADISSSVVALHDRAAVKIHVDAYSAGPNVDIERSVDGGTTWTGVRGNLFSSGGAFDVYDYEAPFYTDLLYRVAGWSDINASPFDVHATSLEPDGNWIKDPLDPTRAMAVNIADWKLNRPEPQARHDLLGSDKAIVTSDGPKAYKGTLTLRTEDEDSYNALLALLGQSRRLLIQDVLGRQFYIRTGDLDFEWLRAITVGEDRHPARHLHRITVPWNEVRAP